MSNFNPPQYVGGYHDPAKTPYPPTYPNQYIQTDNGHAVQGQGQPNEVSNYEAYRYNSAIPGFNPVAVPSVTPVPIFQGWNQDSIPLPPYTTPPNPTSYSGYSGISQHNPSYFHPVNQTSYHQPVAAPTAYDQRELSEGEFDERISSTHTPPTGYRAPQYLASEGVSYVEGVQNSTHLISQNYNSPQDPYTVNSHHSPLEQPSHPRSDSYSPHISPREETHGQSGTKHYSNRSMQDLPLGGPSGNSRQENGQLSNGAGNNAQTQYSSQGNGTPQSVHDAPQGAELNAPSKEVTNATNNRSEAEARQNAQGAILSLLPYDILYQTYIDEGFRAETVARLFDDLKISRTAGNILNGPQPDESRGNREKSPRNLESHQSGHINPSSAISRQLHVAKVEGGAGNSNQGSSSSLLSTIHHHSQPIAEIKTEASFPELATGPTDKERAIQAKMDALRKSREERAQRAAAQRGITVAATTTPVVAPQPQQPRSLEPNARPVPTSVLPAVQLQSPDVAVQVNVVAEPQHPVPRPSLAKPIPNIPGLFLTSSTSSPAPLANAQRTFFASPQGNPRKRPVAADFDSSFTAPVKRPFGHSGVHEALVIDVSEDEESDDEDVAMDIDSEANQDSPIQPTRSLSDLYSSGAQNFPHLANLPKRRIDSPNSSATNTPPVHAVLRPTSTRPADLQRKESEIEELKRRIAQAEARNKARQTPSGTRTPVSSHLNTAEGSNTGNVNATPVKLPDTNNPIPTLANAQIDTSNQIRTSDQANTLEEAAKRRMSEDDGELLRMEELTRKEVAVRTSEVAQHLRKVEETKAELARIEAAAQEATEKLEQAKERGMRFQQEKELRMRRQYQTMQDASNSAIPLPLPSTGASGEESVTAQSPDASVSSLPMRPASAHSNATIDVSANGQIPEVPQAPTSTYATVEEALSNGTHDTTPSTEQQATGVVTPESVKENISSDLAPEKVLLESISAESTSNSLHEHREDSGIPYTPEPTEPAPESPELEYKSAPYSPLEAGAMDPVEDNDDYEPPEATPPIDSPPFSPAPPNENGLLQFDDLMEDIAPSVSDDVSRVSIQEEGSHNVLPDQNGSAPLSEDPKDVPNTQFFKPYESPLRQFRAYRFHPNFAADVPGGLRSLTYSHRIDPNIELCRYELAGGTCNDTTCDSLHFKDIGLKDDAILTSLGSPDQFKESRHVEFCDGLKEVLLGLRKRKIRDFDIIASEILAYRARFLGDDSKILPLEGVSI